MNRLFRVLHRWKCKDAPQKLALDALRRLDGRGAGLFLWHVEPYLRGVAAPEREFRDFTNHVLYPVDGWGGAARLARKWYGTTVETLRTRDWAEAAYAAGVTTRYVSFAFSPPRAGHDEKALPLRQPIDWCVSRLYDELASAAGGAAEAVRPAEGDDWLERLVTSAAEGSYCHLKTVAAKFDLEAVAARPGDLDAELKELFAGLLARGAATCGAVLARAIAEAGVEPPRYPIGAAGLVSLASLPLFWATGAGAGRGERRAVLAMRREFAATGRIEEALPEDARSVRDAYAIEVLKNGPRKIEALPKAEAPRGGDEKRGAVVKPPVKPVAKVSPAASAGALTARSHVGAVTAIDPKLVPRLESAGVRTVGDLLAAEADELAGGLGPGVTASDVAAWQDQARLACAVPALTAAEAQLLVACGVTGPDDLAALSPVELWELVIPVAESPDGRRLLKGAAVPDLDGVTRWIEAAKRGRKAA